MPDAIITSTASTFGTITGTFAADQSTITGTVTGIITGTLDGSVGVPGVGVPDGGTTGQVLQKATNTSYDTVWATPSGGAWGTITGTLSNQTDLQTALNLKAPLASPSLTGVPTAPTAATLTSTTQLATTAFVQQELLSGTANAKNLEVYVRNQTGSTIPAGSIVYINGATGNRPTITLAQANNDANSAQTFGFVKTAIANNGFGFVIVRGELENIDTSALTEGVQLYLSPTTAGTWTTTKPSAPQHLVYVGIVVRAHPTQGVILVAVQNGYELNELHDVQITSPTNGQVLKYNSSTSLWYNGLDVGIPVGGTAGQFLTKIDGTDYNTDWTTVNLSVYAVKSNNLSDLTSASTARTNLGLGTMATATAADYSTTTVANGLYYPLTGNPSGFITSSALTGYATESWVTAGFYPLTGNPSGFITSSALTPYLTSATAASTYQTLSGMSSYLTTSAAASTYAALAGATFTGVVGLNGASGNVAAKSTGYFKAYTSGAENTDYSLQYDTGFQVVVGSTTVARIAASGILAPSAGITFSDATTQTSAGITAATAASTYYPLTGNPSSFLVAADIAGKANTASPALTGNVTITTNSTSPALVITQDGTGDIVQFKDVTSDTTYSFIDASGKVGTIASTTAKAGFNIAHGVAPTTPVNGDIWTTTGGLFMRQNGSTKQYVDFDGTQTINGSKTFSNASNTFGNSTATGTTSIASGATISGATKAVNLGTSGVAGSTTNITIGSTTGTSTTTLQGITNGVTQSAGDNTTKLATTAFVTAAVPATATHLQSLQFAASSFAKVSDNGSQVIAPSILHVWPSPSNYNGTATSGAGASAALYLTGYILTAPSAGVAGSARAYHGNIAGDLAGMLWGGSGANVINFSRRVSMAFRFAQYPSDNNSVTRVLLGKIHGTAVGDLTTRGIGVKYVPSGGGFYFYLQVHNGTTLTNVVGSTQYAGGVADLEVVSDGAGNATLYLNGASIATSTAAPTGQTGANATVFAEIESTASTTVQTSATIGRLYVNSNNF